MNESHAGFYPQRSLSRTISLTSALTVLVTMGAWTSQAQSLGRELQELERNVASPSVPPPSAASAPGLPLINPPQPAVRPPAGTTGETVSSQDLIWRGDISLLESTQARRAFLSAIAASPISLDAAATHMAAMQKELVDAGYFLARVWMEFGEGSNVLVLVDGGRVGEISLHETNAPYKDLNPSQRKEQRTPYQGHFSRQQIERRLGEIKTGAFFNYNTLHRQLFDINATPDITVNTDLHIRTQDVANDQLTSRRFMDLHFYIEDRMPVHGVVEYKNTGTRGTEPERLVLTLQHLNISKNDDALTLVVPLSMPDPAVLQAISANYILPHQIGKGGGTSLYAGYSRLNIDNVADDVNLDADGYFVGTRYFQRLVNTEQNLFNVALGLTYRELKDEVDFAALSQRQTTGVEMLPISLSLIYASNQPDAMRGRNYATFMSSYNIGADMGITDNDDVQLQRPGARDDFWVQRLEMSRIQSLFGSYNPRSGMYEDEWYVFASADAQYSDDPLLATEQKVAGGFESVRGYPERDAIADRGVSGTFEFRSPVIRGLLTRAIVDRKDIEEVKKMPIDYVQALVFVDAAYLETLSAGDVASSDADLLSVGLGLRLSVGRHTQFKLDYGWPLEDSPNSSDSGRFHFSLQGQF